MLEQKVFSWCENESMDDAEMTVLGSEQENHCLFVYYRLGMS